MTGDGCSFIFIIGNDRMTMERSGQMKERWELIKSDLKKIIIPVGIFMSYLLVGRHFLYTLCPTVLITGFPCPGCGMTRALFAFLRGNFVAAWRVHPFIYVLMVYGTCFVVRRYILRKECKNDGRYLIWILCLMFVFYIYRMIRYFPGNTPMSYYYGSWFYRIWSIIY